MRVQLRDGDTIHKCNATRDMAMRLAVHLFGPTLRVRGDGRWERDADGRWSMQRFNIESFHKLDDAPLSEVVERLRRVEGSAGKTSTTPSRSFGDCAAWTRFIDAGLRRRAALPATRPPESERPGPRFPALDGGLAFPPFPGRGFAINRAAPLAKELPMAETPHPQLAALLQRIAQRTIRPDDRAVGRGAADHRRPRAALLWRRRPPWTGVEPLTVDGAAGPLRARLYAPKASGPLPVVVYFHGGGWVLGDIDSHDKGVRAIAAAGRCLAVSVDYRRAPEAQFPAAAEDCFAALRQIAANAARLGGDPARLAVAGDSAGGNLAAVCALMAREAGAPALAFQLLIYPVVDCDLDGGTYATLGDCAGAEPRPHGLFLGLLRSRPGATRRLAVFAAARRDPCRAAPGAGHRRRHRPPLWRRRRLCAQASRRGGWTPNIYPFPRMTHAFFQAPGFSDDARAAVDAAGAALRRAFGDG